MTTTAESLADRYSRLDSSDLEAIVESPEGDYLPEARDAALAELALRAQSGAPQELPEGPAARPSGARTFFAVLMIFVGGSFIFPGAVLLISLLLDPVWEEAFWGAFMLLAGLALTYAAFVIDEAFWRHLVKTYAVVGFLRLWNPGLHLVTGEAKGGDLTDLLQGTSLIVVALAVHFWRRGVDRRMRNRERSETLEAFE